jgi:hypothetical protein
MTSPARSHRNSPPPTTLTCDCASPAEEPAAGIFLALVPHVVHPIQVGIVEALTWIDRPLSAAQLIHILNGLGGKRGLYSGLLSYHLQTLQSFGVLTVAGSRKVGGGTETYFFFNKGDPIAALPNGGR